MSIESVMPSNSLILCRPLLLLPSIFPSIRIFLNESVLHIRWPKYWSFSFSIIPSKEHPGLISFRMDWLDLLAVQENCHGLHRYIYFKRTEYIKCLGAPHWLRLLGCAIMAFPFSTSNLIFNLQKNTIPVLAAHFPMLQMTQNFSLIISHCTSFLCLVGKKNKLLPHFITKHLPAHWDETPCALL